MTRTHTCTHPPPQTRKQAMSTVSIGKKIKSMLLVFNVATNAPEVNLSQFFNHPVHERDCRQNKFEGELKAVLNTENDELGQI